MSLILIIFSSLLAFASYIVYIEAILKGKAKPHRTTRFCTLLITVLATASLFAQGSTTAIWLSGVFAVGSLIIFILSFRYGMGGWAMTDIICMCISILGIALWKLTTNPVYALFASIGADLAGQVPMLIKTYHFPDTEVWTFYFLDVVAAIFSLIASHQLVLNEFLFPLYIVGIDGITILLILRPIFALKKSQTIN